MCFGSNTSDNRFFGVFFYDNEQNILVNKKFKPVVIAELFIVSAHKVAVIQVMPIFFGQIESVAYFIDNFHSTSHQFTPNFSGKYPAFLAIKRKLTVLHV